MLRTTPTRWWSPAFTLTERARARQRHEPDEICDARGSTALSTDAATDARQSSRLDRWRQQRPFDRPEILERRLRLDALTEAEFTSLLAESSDGPSAIVDAPPSWVAAIGRAQAHGNAASATGDSGVEDTAGAELARAFVGPFVIAGLTALFERARRIREAHPDAPFDPEHATRLFEPALWAQLVNKSVKVGILELNVARVQGRLAGDTPEARYADFARLLRTTDLRQRILEEYPVLARLIVTTSGYWEEFAAEFLQHLSRDAGRLSAELAGGEHLGQLTELTAGAGDTHRHGRSVLIAAFSSGKCIVYKPRSLAVDLCFSELVAWANERGQSPPLHAVRTVSSETHGWAEFAAQEPCTTPDEVTRFYERFGSYLALLHALEATDFHYENVIASGEHPMLIDLEALCHPRSVTPPPIDDPEWIGWSALQHSVLRAGVLPFRAFGNRESSGLDMSAVGGGGVQRTPNRFPVVVGAGTDEMRLVRDFVDLPASNNRPALGNEIIDPTHHVDRILAGFTSTYRLLLRHRDELLADGGPIRRFAAAPIRVVLRPTRQYALILLESYHPDVLRDALDRDRLLDRLWVAVPSRPELESVVAYEHADLVAGDVPLFTSRPDSRDLLTTHGACIADFFEQSGLDAALARVTSLSEDDLVRQQWVVRASLVGLAPGRHVAVSGSAPAPRAVPNATSAPPSRDACIGAAERIAGRISALALRQSSRLSWLGLTLAQERDWVIQPIGSDLYGGTLGVALFLAYLADITGNREHEQLSRDVLEQVTTRARLLLDPEQSSGALTPGAIGAFGSLGGAIYTLSHVGVLWQDHALLDFADAVAARVREEAAVDRELDIITGVAGLIFALAALHRARPGAAVHDVMRVSVQRLLDSTHPIESGLAWKSSLDHTQPLTGFSHGASGIAAALFTAGAILNDPRCAAVAHAALRYERDTFDPDRQNWPDYRILDRAAPPGPPAMMWSWCHGAPGVGLARLITLQHDATSDLARASRTELETALSSTVSAGFGSNDSLCHGDLGNLELFLRARELGTRGPWESRLAFESSRLVERIARGDWRCGIPGGVETPGLMMGLAGIGYGLLRIGATQQVPSLLSLEAPRGNPLARIEP